MTDSDFLPGTLWHALASPQRVEIVAADAARVWYETLTTRQGTEPRRASFYTVTRTRFEARFEPDDGRVLVPVSARLVETRR